MIGRHHIRRFWTIARLGALAGPLFVVTIGSAESMPAPVEDILLARPFTLEEPYTSQWQAEKPEVASGHVVALRVRPSLVRPHAGAMPVLCAGDVTVEWLNTPYPSGILVGVIRTDLDLLDTLIWFARHAYPSEMTSEKIAAERLAAIEAGITPLDPLRITFALAEGGEPLQAADRSELRAYADELIATYVPSSE